MTCRARRRALIALCALSVVTAGRMAAAQQSSPDRQLWTDFVPSWKIGAQATNDLEFSFRTAWQGAAPTQYWATDTFEWNALSWLGLDAMGSVTSSRGPTHGTGYLELRPSAGVRLTWRSRRLRANEFMRVEHRMLHPIGGAESTIERVRHREQVQWAINHSSLTASRTAYLLSDAEWFFVHGDHDGWASNQLRVRAGLGLRWSDHRSFEVILNDTRRRAGASQEFEDGDHVLRLRWKEVFGR